MKVLLIVTSMHVNNIINHFADDETFDENSGTEPPALYSFYGKRSKIFNRRQSKSHISVQFVKTYPAVCPFVWSNWTKERNVSSKGGAVISIVFTLLRYGHQRNTTARLCGATSGIFERAVANYFKIVPEHLHEKRVSLYRNHESFKRCRLISRLLKKLQLYSMCHQRRFQSRQPINRKSFRAHFPLLRNAENGRAQNKVLRFTVRIGDWVNCFVVYICIAYRHFGKMSYFTGKHYSDCLRALK